MAAFIAYAVVNTLWIYLRAYRSRSWPTVKGMVVNSTIGKRYCSDPEGIWDGWVYTPIVDYTYRIKGIAYEANRICFDEQVFFENLIGAEYFTESFSKEAIIDIYYNPTNHQDTVLKPGIINEYGFKLGLTVFFIMWPLIIWALSSYFG